jgi:DNA/RNA-binding domain of Phe-tRNA-synthetase-like protein
LTNEPEAILSRPEVNGFKELFARMGYSKQTPAGHRLIESFRQRGFKSYNNIVDAYNIASAQFGSGLGMHDATEVTKAIHVFRASGVEQIIPLFKSDSVKITKGDLVYSSGDRILAWLGKRDLDSNAFKITDDTDSVLLIVLGNAATSENYNRSVCLKVLNLIQKTCPSATVEFVNVIFHSLDQG